MQMLSTRSLLGVQIVFGGPLRPQATLVLNGERLLMARVCFDTVHIAAHHLAAPGSQRARKMHLGMA